MAEKMRYNKIIDLLEHGKPVFSTSTVPNGSLDDLTYIADADYDAVIIEMEHEGFSFTTLRTSLQVLLNRKRIAEKGNLQPDVVPMVRIPPNARERNQWVIKQAPGTCRCRWDCGAKPAIQTCKKICYASWPPAKSSASPVRREPRLMTWRCAWSKAFASS